MNEKKLAQIFAAARKESPPPPSPDFAADVLCAVRREPPLPAGAAFSVWDHLNGLFPRAAVAAVAVIVLCVAADWGFTAAGLPDLSDGVAQASSQFLFNAEDL